MKSFALLYLIPYVLAYRGMRPRTHISSDYNLNYDDQISNTNAQLWEESDIFTEEMARVEGIPKHDFKITVPIHKKTNKQFPRYGIQYKVGSKVLTGNVAVYIIYYGTWTSQQKDLLNEFTGSLGDSSNRFLFDISLVEHYAKVLLSKIQDFNKGLCNW